MWNHPSLDRLYSSVELFYLVIPHSLSVHCVYGREEIGDWPTHAWVQIDINAPWKEENDLIREADLLIAFYLCHIVEAAKMIDEDILVHMKLAEDEDLPLYM